MFGDVSFANSIRLSFFAKLRKTQFPQKVTPYHSMSMTIPSKVTRLSQLSALRESIFGIPSNNTTTSTSSTLHILRQPSKRRQLLTHYPPNINYKLLAAKDSELSHLGLVDVRFEELKKREERFIARGKAVRVSGRYF